MLSTIETVLFDLDGTLTVPVIDFAGLRAKLNLADGASISHALNTLPDEERDRGFAIVQEEELAAARNTRPNIGAVELVRWLQTNRYAVGIITRNFRGAVDVTLEKLGISISVIITRDCAPPKPAPDPVLEALRRLRRKPGTTLVVGDYQDDLLAGHAAGTHTCLVANANLPPPSWKSDLVVNSPDELLRLFEAAKENARP